MKSPAVDLTDHTHATSVSLWQTKTENMQKAFHLFASEVTPALAWRGTGVFKMFSRSSVWSLLEFPASRAAACLGPPSQAAPPAICDLPDQK